MDSAEHGCKHATGGLEARVWKGGGLKRPKNDAEPMASRHSGFGKLMDQPVGNTCLLIPRILNYESSGFGGFELR